MKDAIFSFRIKQNKDNYSIDIPLTSTYKTETENLQCLINSIQTITKTIKNELPNNIELNPLVYIPTDDTKSLVFNIKLKDWSFFQENGKPVQNPFKEFSKSFKGVFFIKFTTVSYSETTKKYYINDYLQAYLCK